MLTIYYLFISAALPLNSEVDLSASTIYQWCLYMYYHCIIIILSFYYLNFRVWSTCVSIWSICVSIWSRGVSILTGCVSFTRWKTQILVGQLLKTQDNRDKCEDHNIKQDKTSICNSNPPLSILSSHSQNILLIFYMLLTTSSN